MSNKGRYKVSEMRYPVLPESKPAGWAVYRTGHAIHSTHDTEAEAQTEADRLNSLTKEQRRGQ